MTVPRRTGAAGPHRGPGQRAPADRLPSILFRRGGAAGAGASAGVSASPGTSSRRSAPGGASVAAGAGAGGPSAGAAGAGATVDVPSPSSGAGAAASPEAAPARLRVRGRFPSRPQRRGSPRAPRQRDLAPASPLAPLHLDGRDLGDFGVAGEAPRGHLPFFFFFFFFGLHSSASSCVQVHASAGKRLGLALLELGAACVAFPASRGRRWTR